MPRRGITVAVIVILACLIVLRLASSFLVDWAWFSAVGYLGVFWTILGSQAALFFAVFAGSAVLLWVNGFLAHRFARRRGHVRRVDFEQVARGVQTLPELLGLMGQRLPWRLLIAGVAVVLGILVAAGEVSNWGVFLRFAYQVPYGKANVAANSHLLTDGFAGYRGRDADLGEYLKHTPVIQDDSAKAREFLPIIPRDTD